MLFLLISILGSAAISVILRFSEGVLKNRYSMLAANYALCTVLSLCYAGVSGAAGALNSVASWLGVLNGLTYLVSLVLSQVNIRKNGVVMPAIYSKISMLVPLAVSLLIYAEYPSAGQIVGSVLALIAILIMNWQKGTGFSFNMLLLALFLVDGVGATLTKVFNEMCPAGLQSAFLFFTFASALLMCLIPVIRNGERPGWKDILFGCCIGLPNFYASRCMLKALETLPAFIVYPARGAGVIVAVALAGVLLFHEALSRRKKLGTAMIVVAVVLLNL